MEAEDFDDDTITQLPARSGPRVAGKAAATERFGLAGEMDGESGADRSGLAGELHRLGFRDTQPQEFGLDAELTPSGRAAGGSRPLGALGPSPLGPPARMPPPEADAFGLAAETAIAADPRFRAGAQPPRSPLVQPLPSTGFGLAGELNARPLVPQPDEYGLDSDVRVAAADGVLQPARPLLQRPADGYGLNEDIKEAEVATAQPLNQYGIRAAGSLPLMSGDQPGSGLPLMTTQLQEQGYGLENDIAQQQQLQQGAELWSRPLANTVPLELLAEFPEEQRWLHLEARQAERFMHDLQRQGTQPKIVDLKDVRDKLIEASAPPRLGYLAAVEQAAEDHRLPPNCRPSLLQTKLKAGQNRLRKLVEPVMDPGGQGFVDLSYTPDGALRPEINRVWQFGLSLVQADGVGKTGLQRVRQPCLFIARLALFDRRANRFLGNVLGVRPDAVSHYDKRWEFNPSEQVIVRCGCVQSDPQAGTRLASEDALSVFVEFNISYRLTVEDTVNIPQNEHKASQLLDEVNTCWAMISFKKCLSLQREIQITVPLYYGSIYDPQPMTSFYAEKRRFGMQFGYMSAGPV